MRARKVASVGRPYNYSGTIWPEVPIPEVLSPVFATVGEHVGYLPNNCLVNWYPDGSSTMGYHSDATDNLVEGTHIAIVSLGAQRTLTFRNQADHSRLEAHPLPAGSLMILSAAMQPLWKHAILASPENCGGRMSLTFRCVKSSA
jgi:alkylated DNA repair dioxygenase AlkB